MKARLTFALLVAVALGGCSSTRIYPLNDGFSQEVDLHVRFAPEVTVCMVTICGPVGLLIPPLSDAVTRTRLIFGEEVLTSGYVPLAVPWDRRKQCPISELTAGGREIARARKWQWIGNRDAKWHLLIGNVSMKPLSDDVGLYYDGPWRRTPRGDWKIHLDSQASLPGGEPDSVLFVLDIRTKRSSRAVAYDAGHWQLEGIGPIRSVKVSDYGELHAHCTVRMRNKRSGKRMHILICCDNFRDINAWVYEQGDPVPDCVKLRAESPDSAITLTPPLEARRSSM